MNMRLPLAVAAFVFAADPQPADALLCVAILGCSCSVGATDMAFGQISPLSGAPATATADINVHCTGVVDALPSVSAKIGAGANGTIADRQMKNAANDRLHYNIYSSTLYATILGDGTGGYPALTINGGLLSLGSWTATAHVYGRIPAAVSSKPGVYSDTVVVRIDW